MKYSKPAKRVRLISIAADGVAIDDLLTERLTAKHKWVKQGVQIGDSGIHPATPLLELFKKHGIADLFQFVDLKPIGIDGLENICLIGGDGDGHDYVVGTESQQFYVMWHDPTKFEVVATTTKAFLQWVIHERSDHLKGCPWEILPGAGSS